jgi:hypothetical protein
VSFADLPRLIDTVSHDATTAESLNYLDSLNGEYVLFKSVESTSFDGRSNQCVFAYRDTYGIGAVNSTSVNDRVQILEIRVTLNFGTNRFGNPYWNANLSLQGHGVSVRWDVPEVSGSLPSVVSYDFDADDIFFALAETAGTVDGLDVSEVLSETTATVREFNQTAHGNALTPCECFDGGVGLPLFKATCLQYTGKEDPGLGTNELPSRVNERCSPADAPGWCNTPAIEYTVRPGGASTGPGIRWLKYGEDELEVDLSDITTERPFDLPPIVYPTEGTYAIPFVGTSLRAIETPGGSFYSCVSSCGGVFLGVVGGYAYQSGGWAAAFPFEYDEDQYLLAIAVSLRRVSAIPTTIGFPDVIRYETGRRLWLSASISTILPIGTPSLDNLTDTNISYQSDGTAGEDAYTCGNMPTVSGGGTSNKYLACCTLGGQGATTFNWTVRQA